MANYTLTSNKNAITGTTLADTFFGTYDGVSGGDTFNSVDILNGGSGVDTLQINHFQNVAITPPDALWTGISNIEKLVFKTTGDGAQTITTGSAFEAAFRAAGVNLTSTTSGAGAIGLTMSGFTGAATLATTSLNGAQTIVTGSGASTATATSGAGAIDIRGAGLQKVTANTKGAGAQTIGDNSGNGKNLVDVLAKSSGGAQTIISTSTSAVKVNATSDAGQQNITTGSGSDAITATTSAEINRITANAGNDRITVLSTSSGAYILDGGTGNDTLYGGAGADKLIGGSGHDVLNGGAGADTMTGGDGNDTYYVDSAGDVVTETNSVASTGGTDHVHSYLSAYTLGAHIENGRILASGTASLTGNSLNNLLYAGAGSNALDGGAGTDTVSYYAASAGVTVSLAATGAQATGGSGNDTLKNIENLSGSSYADRLTGSTGNNALSGGAGNDTLNGGAGVDTMTGGDGSDTYYVANVGDVVTETNSVANTGGTDHVHSYLSAYTLGANVENGRILATGTGTASLSGNSLNNVLYAGAGSNVLDGGAATDTVSYQYATAGITASLATTTAQATGGSGSDTLKNVENLYGSSYADSLTGNTGNNALNGGTGSDILSGGAGNDILTGGLGADRLTGGTGADRFDFNALNEMGLTSSTRDTITDFKTSEGDKIDLSTLDANTALAGNQAFSAPVVGGTFSGAFANAGDLYFDNVAHILYGNTDGDAAAEFAIVLTGVTSLSATAFVL